MKKELLIIPLLMILVLGCTSQQNTDTISGSDVEISLSSAKTELSQGRSTSLTATVKNFYKNTLENGELRIIHNPDLEINEDTKTGINVPVGGSPFRVAWSVKAKSNAIPRNYNLKAEFCFDYKTVGYHEIIFSNIDATSTPQKGGGEGPIRINISELEPVNVEVLPNAYPTVRITNIGPGSIVQSTSNSAEAIRKITIKIDNPNEYISIIKDQLSSEFTIVQEGDPIIIEASDFESVEGEIEFPIPLSFSEDVSSEQITTLSVTAEYTYCVTSPSITITVKSSH